jgi:alpha-L-fucosidase
MDKKMYLNHIDQVIEEGKFKDNWASLSQYRLPEWYRNAKFGIFIHWGVYSVPAYSSEWYPRYMYIKDSPVYNYHIEHYGPQKEFGYKEFIPMFKAKKFDPEEWAEIFNQSGAKYVTPVAEHHDGFQMYKSEISHWNAYEMGPKRDVLLELKKAVERRNMNFCASSHRAEHYFFLGHGKEFDSDIKEPLACDDFYWPSMPEPDYQDLFGPSPSEEYLEDWLIRTCEIVERFQPKLIYFDWWIQHSAFKPYLKKFAAYYYNKAQEWGSDAVINYKHDAFAFGTAVVDIERGKFAEQKPYFWQTDTSIAKNSWCYTEYNRLNYKTANSIICDLVDIVSKNGCLMLNIDPKANGTIPQETRKILLQIGQWLGMNGEAIYGSSIWRYFGEGLTKTVEGQFTDSVDTVYTKEDIRFTVKNGAIYAAVLSYPKDGMVHIKSLAEQDASKLPLFHDIVKQITVLGNDEIPQWSRNVNALTIRTGSVQSDLPVVFKILVE